MRRLGIWLRPEVEVVRDMPVSRKDLVRVMTAAIRQNTPVLLETLSSKWIGAPFITALAFLGIFHRPWGRSVAVGRLYLFLVPATAILASFSVLWPFSRYYFVLVPFLLIWASNGLLELKQWIRSSFAASPWAWLRTGLWPWVIPGLLGFGVLIYPMRAIGSLYEFTEGSRESRVVEETGIWIGRQQNVPVTIMDRYTPLAFYADAQFVYFPYCSGDLALRFLDASQVDYVILRRNERFTPYYEDWLAKGVPDSRAELVYTSPGPDAGKIVVYRWHREYSRPPALPTPSGGEPH